MKTPAECFDDAADLLAEDSRDPVDIAAGEQHRSRGVETFEQHLAGEGMKAAFPYAVSTVGVRAVAFQMAAVEALSERMSEPEMRLCEHMTTLQVAHIVELTNRFIACERCAPARGILCSGWSEDRCDVCGAVSEERVFTPVSFTLGPALAFAHVCDGCRDFMGMTEGAD